VLDAFLNERAVEDDHHEDAGKKHTAAHALGSGRQLADGFGISAVGENGDRVKLLEGS